MKSAEDWARCGYILTNEIKQIQLDAMREGMRRAAHCPVLTYLKDVQGYENARNFDCGISTLKTAILSAADQLTEKDL